MSVASRTRLIGWLFPSPDEPGRAIARRAALRLIVSLTFANLVGTAVVGTFLYLVLPTPEVDDPTETLVVNLVAGAIYVSAGLVVGTLWGLRRLRGLRHWLYEDRPATPEDRVTVLRAPYRIATMHAILWGVSAVMFGVLNWGYSHELAQRVATTILLGGLTTAAIAFLATERGLRRAAARALAETGTEGTLAPSVKSRAMLAWVLGTGIPLVGIAMIAVSTLTERDFSRNDLAIAALALAGIGIVIGFLVTALAARAVADPIKEVRGALAEVEGGRLDVEVPVYDGSEIGLLQAGFNRMVAGLREREHIHDLFGRQVGPDVVRAALEKEVELGGETREVSVLFVDMVGSTKLASERDPAQVVEILNEFFGIVVEVVREHGGWVNKFEGDAALAVFGAPVSVPDHAGQALASAREMARRLTNLDGIEAGIGVSCGQVVAGNIGSEKRYEYTVIGDAVNEAARLTELAKNEGGVLASGSALEHAGEEERSRWSLDGTAELRGRSQPTRLAKPRR